mgnify:FL=1
MIVVDSSVWLEHLQGTRRAALFAEPFCNLSRIVVPSLVLFEVHRVLAGRVDEEAADLAVGFMRKAKVVDLDPETALRASVCAREHGLATADALIYATSLQHRAELWTQDAHFRGLPGVKFFAKASRD